LADWFVRLCKDSGTPFQQRGASAEGLSFGPPNEFNVFARFIEDPPYLRFEASDENRQSYVDNIARSVAEQTNRGNLGGIVWYSTNLREPERDMRSHSVLSMIIPAISDRLQIRGWRRLGNHILIEFKDDIPPDPASRFFQISRANIDVHVAVPGPCAGDFSNVQARYYIELIEAICTLALGREVDLPPMYFPSEENKTEDLNARASDPSIPGLARRRISLDIFNELVSLGGVESHRRVSAALMTYSAAMRQERDPVACMLYVIAAEALTTPFTPWKNEKLTKHFKEFFDELMPDDLNQIIAHRNFEESFNIRRGSQKTRSLRRELLEKIYNIRSGLVTRASARVMVFSQKMLETNTRSDL
jgi:hypothetical protein